MDEQLNQGVVDNSEGIQSELPDQMISRKDEYKDWIKMTPEEMQVAQENGSLMGYNPDKGLGLVNVKAVVKVKETKKK